MRTQDDLQYRSDSRIEIVLRNFAARERLLKFVSINSFRAGHRNVEARFC